MPAHAHTRSSSSMPIDVLIPAIEKDLVTLPHVIDAVKKHVKHPIRRILIVAPYREKIVDMCRRKGCKFINENTVLPFTKKDIHYRSKKWERSGWLFQQLLKWSGDKLCKSDYFLVIDADTVLIRPHVFRSGGRTMFYCRTWTQPEYYRTYRRLMKRKPTAPLSFVTHYMLFNRSKLAQLKRSIEAKHQTKWYTAIQNSMNKARNYGFSEFETYGNYMYTRSPGALVLKKALNKGLSMKFSQVSPDTIKKLAAKYRSISFHKRKGYARK
ncbi:DUF6492 family protein [Paenibacillus sp. HJGM_3]|uniref:DUF6492 family protein n=1 Tax=Paenibacillus sp. HJGM_3 TaxID=3379816 RepID=UPI00385C0D09